MEIPKVKGHFEDLGVDGRIILINKLTPWCALYLTQDRDHSQARVSMVMYLGIPYRAGKMGWPAEKLSGSSPMHVKALTRNTRTMLVNSGFPHAKEFLLKLSVVGAHVLKNVLQPCSRPKFFKECLFEGEPN